MSLRFLRRLSQATNFRLVLAAALTTLAAAQTSQAQVELPTAPWLQTPVDVSGAPQPMALPAEREALVYVFLSTECPIAKSYIQTLNQLAKQWQATGQANIYGIFSDPTLSRQQAKQFVKEYKIAYPVLFDHLGDLANFLQPTHVPEAFVINSHGQVAYRGRIDDLYAEVGKRRLVPSENNLRDAVTALSAGRQPLPSHAMPVGCFFERNERDQLTSQINYNRHIAPIIHRHCTSCHREGEVAPFPLSTYQDVSKRAQQIAYVIEEKIMPPWRPTDPYGHFIGDRRLSAHQRDALLNWIEQGTPEGDPKDRPEVPKFTAGWQLGTPDLIIKMPEPFSVPADGPDIYQNFVVPLNLETDKFCIAAEFRPGASAVVHHAILYLDTNGKARKLDLEDPQPGYSTFGGPGFIPTGGVGGWTPGSSGTILPNDFARYVKAGSDLVIQIHYHPTGKREIDQSMVGLHFIEKPKNIVGSIIVGELGFELPAGENRQTVTASYTLPDDIILVGTTPHMHLLGRSMKAIATFPDGTQQQLIAIDDWHFYWQDQYLLANPIRLPQGTQIDVEAVFDNSRNNPFNPSNPPARVTYGEESTDEMCYLFLLVATDDPHDLKSVVKHNLRGMLSKHIQFRLSRRTSNLFNRAKLPFFSSSTNEN